MPESPPVPGSAPEGARASTPTAAPTPPAGTPAAASGTPPDGAFAIIRKRLETEGAQLQEKMSKLDARRQEVFGSIPFQLLRSDRIVTVHNCIPQDMVQLGEHQFLFGFNVQFGLKKEYDLTDVFALYEHDSASSGWKEASLDPLRDKAFLQDFKRLYHIYEKAQFQKFSVIEGRLFMVFSTGPGVNDIAVFKWDFQQGRLRFLDGRAETEFKRIGFPSPHEFKWLTPERNDYKHGDYPHVSIQDRVFVECVGGDLTIKVEDNTKSGEGIHAEPVQDKHQKVDDAEVQYAVVDHLILLRIKPYKELKSRYFIYNEKQQSVVRVDSIGSSCVLLPESHGLIFPDGYYLSSGDLKRFESDVEGLIFERVIHAPNGEDSLYVFYERVSGSYALLPYRLIQQKVEERISCHGYSLFPNGHLVLFRAENEPQRHHLIQLRQTPFHLPGYEPQGRKETFLYQVGNRDVVRCLAECNEVLSLIRKDTPYALLYTDVIRRCEGISDSYTWLSGDEGFGIRDSLKRIAEAADKAVYEFDKIRQLQKEAQDKVAQIRKRSEDRLQTLRRTGFRTLNDFVDNLTALRGLRGELIALRDVRFVPVTEIEALENKVVQHTDDLSRSCVQFLLQTESLEPYRHQASEFLAGVEKITTVAGGRKMEEGVGKAGTELEMLISIVNGLKIEDATETTRIIDGITAVYSVLNQVKAALKKRIQHLSAAEGAAQFAAQIKLLGQAASSYLDLCDTPAKCDEYLNKLSVQLEELEGAFADFDEYTVQLSERRTELYEAFEQRKIALVEQRNRKAGALLTAADRILKVIQNRLAGFSSIEEINAYIAADPMVAKVRDLIAQLTSLEDTVKADSLMGRLKSAQQDAVRQLKDRQDLFSEGPGLIKLGRHVFNVNTQPLDLTVVLKEGAPYFHLTSTQYFDAITHTEFLETRDTWGLETLAESPEVYRAEYLAWQILTQLESAPHRGSESDQPAPSPLERAAQWSAEERLARVQEVVNVRYQEGYTKGVHDHDATLILESLLQIHVSLGLARHHPTARACAMLFWLRFCPDNIRTLWTTKLTSFGSRNRLFPGDPVQRVYIQALQEQIEVFLRQHPLFPPEMAEEAALFLFQELIGGDSFALSQEAHTLAAAFRHHLMLKRSEEEWLKARQALTEHPASQYETTRDWVRGFLLTQPGQESYVDEVATILDTADGLKSRVVNVTSSRTLEGLRGQHPRVHGSRYTFDYRDFQARLRKHHREVVPRFQTYHQLKQSLLESERNRLRLDEFKPRVLTSFVRNQLIDAVYLPRVGDNLAKQIGAAGNAKRTDLMGMLLLISPPGYGKTTLMEYLASRLGLVFIKINGPSLGHSVTSLDPEEAPNAAAREEIQKLNLALEMGDNVLLCIDDIQHCNPEFLQKFISLCDAQRKMEGVWKGRSRTYDLRGRKVVVVMAGNPYTESGQKFKIPDMLANRADTYNLGDIIGGSADHFKASYLENAVTSNPALAPLAQRSQKDVRTFIRMATTGERTTEGFESTYSSQEVEEVLSVFKKLVRIREIVLQVNLEYIHSAAQADEFRTEPPFRLQGSYRNMNRLAEKVVSIMNDQEVLQLVVDHYKGESQTLTTGAEANLLKFKHMIGVAAPAEAERWKEICKTFQRNTVARGTGSTDDPVQRVVNQLAGFQSGLSGIQETLASHLGKAATPPTIQLDLSGLTRSLESLRDTVVERLSPSRPAETTPSETAPMGVQLAEGLRALREDLTRAITAVHHGSMAEKVSSLSHEMEMIHSTLATLKDVASHHRDHVRRVEEMLVTKARDGTVELPLTQDMLNNEKLFLERIQQILQEARGTEATPPPIPTTPPPATS